MTIRPAVADSAGQPIADRVAAALAAELEQALLAGDADGYDHSFAADILWGSPFGSTVTGYPALNAIHHRLMTGRAAPSSRFEVVAALNPAPGVVVTQILRRAAESAGFSELAMYTLVERDGAWWLAAAQNTPVDPSRSSLVN